MIRVDSDYYDGFLRNTDIIIPEAIDNFQKLVSFVTKVNLYSVINILSPSTSQPEKIFYIHDDGILFNNEDGYIAFKVYREDHTTLDYIVFRHPNMWPHVSEEEFEILTID